jgi:hypothetical protein
MDAQGTCLKDVHVYAALLRVVVDVAADGQAATITTLHELVVQDGASLGAQALQCMQDRIRGSLPREVPLRTPTTFAGRTALLVRLGDNAACEEGSGRCRPM